MDYFFNSTCFAVDQRHMSLNEVNGHEHDDLGFHYHLSTDSNHSPAFPFSSFFGCMGGDIFDSTSDSRHRILSGEAPKGVTT